MRVHVACAVGVLLLAAPRPVGAREMIASAGGLRARAAAFYEAYGTALRTPDRRAIPGFYHHDGVLLVVNGRPHRLARADIDSIYGGPWSPPAFFTWEGLAFDSIAPGRVIATGGFRWQSTGRQDTLQFVYAALLEATDSSMAIRFEHETSKPRP